MDLKKNKGGRPSMEDPGDKKSVRFTFRVSESEKALIDQYAKFTNCSSGEFVRNCVFKEMGVLVKEKPTEDQKELRQELRRIGVNLNQIATKVNSQNSSSIQDQNLQRLLVKLENKLDEI